MEFSVRRRQGPQETPGRVSGFWGCCSSLLLQRLFQSPCAHIRAVWGRGGVTLLQLQLCIEMQMPPCGVEGGG